jgi:hypothetical protein
VSSVAFGRGMMEVLIGRIAATMNELNSLRELENKQLEQVNKEQM